METFEAIAQRKSIRSYTGAPVEKADLEKIVAAGNAAPCAGQISIAVITDTEYLAEIDEATFAFMQNSGVEFLVKRSSTPGYRPLYGAPALVVISSDPERGTANVAAAAATMILAATDLGLGSCYVGSPTRVLQAGEALAERLNLPAGFTPLAGVLLGTTDDPARFSRDRAPADNVTFIG
ncbi:MAG: nitroreductase family protein [Clostridiales Family XIII bacterium]|jgi:nitroreductase|nr:nitroreductase family protein [Clostridiales Family XIII bacterium]